MEGVLTFLFPFFFTLPFIFSLVSLSCATIFLLDFGYWALDAGLWKLVWAPGASGT